MIFAIWNVQDLLEKLQEVIEKMNREISPLPQHLGNIFCLTEIKKKDYDIAMLNQFSS